MIPILCSPAADLPQDWLPREGIVPAATIPSDYWEQIPTLWHPRSLAEHDESLRQWIPYRLEPWSQLALHLLRGA